MGVAKVEQNWPKWKSTFGAIFRALFIIGVGYFAYAWLHPSNIGDTPFSQLTPNSLFNNIAAVAIAIGCFYWLFNPSSYEERPYELWYEFGKLVLIVGAIYFAWIWSKNSTSQNINSPTLSSNPSSVQSDPFPFNDNRCDSSGCPQYEWYDRHNIPMSDRCYPSMTSPCTDLQWKKALGG